jgi:hypothetical protein
VVTDHPDRNRYRSSDDAKSRRGLVHGAIHTREATIPALATTHASSSVDGTV